MKNKRSILFLICFFTFFVFKAQTLYWIGGSGNFNDPKNWSFNQSGISSNITPNINSDVVFDNITVNGDVIVTIPGNVSIKSLDVNCYHKIKFVKSSVQSRVTIQSDFINLLDNTNFTSDVVFEFKNNYTSHNGTISSGENAFNADFIISGGKWQVSKLKIDNNHSFIIKNSIVEFNSSIIQVGNFNASNCNSLVFDNALIKCNNDFTFNNVVNYTVQKSYLNARSINNIPLANDNSGIANRFTSSSVIMSPCITTPTVIKPSCAPGCDGAIVITIPSTNSACYATPPVGPFNVQITNAVGCNTVAGLTNVNPGTYTINNVCACNSAYGIILFDQNGFIESDNASVTNPVINPITVSSKSVTCFGACTGSIATAFVGGISPYNFTVTPPGGLTTFSSSAGGLNLTNLCAGTLTIIAKDSKGCNTTFTFNVNQPAAFNPHGNSTNASCNGACIGAVSVAPTGGTASYTVNWSTGASAVLSAGQTSSLTGLCASPVAITATVTDTRGCVYPAVYSAIITQPPAFTVTPTQTLITCGGSCTGGASVNVSGGTPPYSYTWSPGPSNSAGMTNLCSGTHSVFIKDFANCSAQTQTFSFNPPPAITLTPTFTNVSCNALCNATASMTGSGGSGAITYTWVAPGSSTIAINTSSVTNLCAGTYTVFGKDAIGCTKSVTLTITQPPPLTITAVSQSITCFGLCNGGGTVTPSGGNGSPFSYSWSPGGQNAASISTLCVGTFTIAVKDASNCPISTTLTITQPSSVIPNITTSSLTCNGVSSGSINANPTPLSAGPFSYTLASASSTVFTAPPYTNLPGNIYTLTIGYGTGCRQSFTLNIQQPNPLIPSINSTSLSCFNQCTGTLGGSAIGGTSPYTFVWATQAGTVAGGALSSQCAGNYTFTVRDANLCVVTSTINLAQPPNITVSINPTNVNCFSNCNGVLTANVSGGTPGYTLNWSNGFVGSPNGSLCAGNYTLVVNDSKNCSKTTTATVSSASVIVLSQNTTPPSCPGICNGSATISAVGGIPPYTYQFNTTPVTTNTTGIISGLCAGNYIASVSDINNCPRSINFSINSPVALSAAITGLQSSCNSCTGASTVTASNGTPGYSYVWINSLSATVGTNAAISSMCPGNYTVTVTDSRSCTATTTATIVQTVTLTVSTSGSPLQCFNATNAFATANANGGTSPYTYSWSPTAPTQTTQTASNLTVGTYSVLVTDQLGCTNTGTITFLNPPNIVLAPTQGSVNCFGSCTGFINSNASGGTGALTYSWNGGQTTANINSLCAGNYTLRITDVNLCTKTQTFNIATSPSLAAAFTTTNPILCNNTGSLCATVSGGSGSGYTYSWAPSGGVGGTTSCYTSLTAGSYSLVLTDGVGCTATLSTLLNNPTGPTLTINSQSIACFGASTGAATVAASGGGPYTFTWSAGVTSSISGNTTTASSLPTGTYNISVTDVPTGCITTRTIAITQPAASLTINSTLANARCFNACNGSITVIASGGTPGYTYNWLPLIPPITGQNTATITNLCAGNYTLNLTDSRSCTRQFIYVVTQPPALSLTTTAINVACNGNPTGTINVTASGGTSPITFTWLPVGTFTGSTNANIFNLPANTYTINASDLNNCVITQTVQITQPAALTSTISFINPTCSNLCNATASLSVGGGTPTYSFSWSNGAANTSSIGNLCAGNYTGTIIDGNGCVSSKAFTISAPAAFSVTLLPANPLCNSACNGSITTILSGNQGTVNYSWTSLTGTNSAVGQNPTNLCADNYTLSASDAGGCFATGVANLANPPALIANVTTTNPVCNGNCSGIAVSTPANAVGAISYVWTPAASNSPTASSLCDGNYTLAIQDANGCQDVQTFTLVNPPALNINTSFGAATCGSSNGSLTVIPSGGTPAYTYSWSAPVSSTNAAVTGLAAGVYTVIVKDANNCPDTVVIPLSNSNGPSSAPITSSSLSCNSQCTGAASVNIASIVGGTPGYSVTWLTPPSSSSINPQSNLCAGSYTAQIKDANTCLLFTSVVINQPSPIAISPNLSFPTCNGVCDGSIILNTSGGTSPYTYTWSAGTSTNAILSNACSGNYTILIGDFNNCPASTQTITFPGLQNIVATTAVTNNICFGNCIATASVTSISGSANLPITYLWSNAQSGSVVSNLCNGVYTYTATDAIGCFNSFTTNITSPTQISAVSAITSPSCNMCNGMASLTTSGGISPYNYNWSVGSSTVSSASNLCAGLYQVLITDANLCSQTQNINISNSNGISGETTTIQNEICAGQCNGAATVIAVGGNGPISYSWINPVSSNSVITNLCTGTYFLQMTDSVGCIRTTSVDINAATQLTLTPSITPPACIGPPNGAINITPSGGSPNYSFSWIPAAGNTSSLTNIAAGNYTVTVTDFSGCAKTQVFAVSNLNAPVVTYTQNNIACFNACTGSITALGTSTSLPVSYNWSNGGSVPTVSNLCAGIITLTVSSPNGCASIQSFSLTDNPALQLSLPNVVQPKCHDDCNGSIILLPSGGSLPYTFTWSPSGTTNAQFSLCPGPATAAIVYSVTITDSQGCSITTSTTLINPQLIALTQTITNSSCSSIADGSLNIDVNGGTPAYTYTWSGPSFTANTQNISGVYSGTYSLDVMDNNGCIQSSTLAVLPTIVIDAQAGNDVTVCPTPSVNLTGTNSIGAVSYDWFLLPNNISSIANTVTFLAPTPLTSPGSSTFVLVTTASITGCVDRDTVIVNTFALPLIDAGPTNLIPIFSNVMIGGNPTATGSFSLSWLPAETLSDPNAHNPIATNTLNTTYTVTVVDLTTGCSASDTTSVLLYPVIKISNGFSPNSDGKNDLWIIDYLYQFPDITVEIFNRWGEQLFFSKGYTIPFDGKYKGKDLPVGTYYYIINLNHPAYTKPLTGPLTIFR